jgi:hypothetical protein
MAGLVPAIHVFLFRRCRKTWMPGTSPGMTPLLFSKVDLEANSYA